MGYRLNRLDEPVFMAVPKSMLTEFGIHYRLDSCVWCSNGPKSSNADFDWEFVKTLATILDCKRVPEYN